MWHAVIQNPFRFETIRCSIIPCRVEKDKESLKREADEAKAAMDTVTRDKVCKHVR